MKKLLIVLLALIVLAPAAYALVCSPQGPGESDECWTQVKIKEGYTTLVSRGHVIVASEEGITVGNNDAWAARHSRASADEILLGVAQTGIVTGDSGLVLVRGRGAVQFTGGNEAGGIASGDPIAVTEGVTLVSRAGMTVGYDGQAGQEVTAIVGQSLETSTSTSDTDLYTYVNLM